MQHIHVVDEHHDVLKTPPLLDSRPKVLINFDSHPDLGIPEPGTATDIATWIFPLLASGSVTRVVWIFHHAHWPAGDFEVTVGRRPGTKELCVLDHQQVLPLQWLTYWDVDPVSAELDELAELDDARVVFIHPMHLSEAPHRLPSVVPVGTPVVVSIDLDFFDVQNPMFAEVRMLPAKDQAVFQFLTSALPFNDDVRRRTTEGLYKLLDREKCSSCLFKPLPVALQPFIARVHRRLKTIPDGLLSLLIQGANQPHHPQPDLTMYPVFRQCLSCIDQDASVVIAESRIYRQCPMDGLLERILADVRTVKFSGKEVK